MPQHSGGGAAVLGNPVRSVAWLTNELGRLGDGLKEGDVILSAALHRMVPARRHDVFEAHFVHLGSVTVAFTDGVS